MVKIGLLGFGTVASGLPLLLEENKEKLEQFAGKELEIAKILVRDDAHKERLLEKGYEYTFVTDIEDILEDQSIEIVVELIGRIEPAKTYIARALKGGKHVVTANKDLIALHGQELGQLAKDKGLAFYYEAAVAGGIPILRTLADSLVADKVTRLLGILNGTSNFMLTKMVDEGWTYEQALQTAQQLGYAESDPTNDVEGIDAAYKAVILSQFAFGMDVGFSDVAHKGISTIRPEDVAAAQEWGYVIKLVGDIQETPSGLSVEVAPTFLPTCHALASVNGVMNAAFVESFGVGQSMYYGPGAGQKPTATSVVADLIHIARQMDKGGFDSFHTYHRRLTLAAPEDVYHAYYLSIVTPDHKDCLAELSAIFAKKEIVCKQLIRKESQDGMVRVLIMTGKMNKVELTNLLGYLEQELGATIVNTFKVVEA